MEQIHQMPGDQRLDLDFELRPISLKFNDPKIESRFEIHITSRARQYHDGVWLLRAWIVFSRLIHELTRTKDEALVEVYLNFIFVLCVVVAYGMSRRVSRFNEGTASWQVLVVLLCGLHAFQFSLSFFHAPESGSRRWTRFYYLGLDFAIDALMFSLLFGLRQLGAVCALIIDLTAVVLCLTFDGPSTKASAGIPGIVDAIIFVLGLFVCARAQEKASRAAFAREMRHNIRHSIDLRALQQPFSAGNLSAWLRAVANRTVSSTSTSSGCRVESALIGQQSDSTLIPIDSGDEEVGTRTGVAMPSGTFNTTTNNGNELSITNGQPRENNVAPMSTTNGHTITENTPSKDPAAQSFAGVVNTETQVATSTTTPNQQRSEAQNQEQQTGVSKQEAKQKFLRFEALQNWEIDYERLRVARKIGAGSAGHVYKGEYIGAVVAIKQLYSTYIDPSNLDEFSREVTLLHKLKHPHVLTFYGIARRDVYCYIVTEFCPYALDAILSGGRGNDPLSKVPPRLSVTRRVKIAHEVALALAYLHAERVLHHDLKPGNILLNHDFVARVSDFGLSQLVARESESSLHGVSSSSKHRGTHNNPPVTLGGTATFSAPEITLGTLKKGFQALSKLDVFSFGIVLAAVFAPNGDPYYFYVPGSDRTGSYTPTGGGGQAATMAALKNAGTAKREVEIRHAVAHKKLRPKVPNALPAEIRPLMEKCWAHVPEDRPSFQEVAQSLRAYLVRNKELENSTPAHLPVGPEALSVVDE